MLQLYNLDKVKIRGLKLYKDYSIESVLSSGDKTLSFLYPSRLSKDIIEESYIRTKNDEFVVKSISGSGEWKTIVATLNVEDLEGKVFESFETSNKTISESLNLALAGTGWTVGTCDITRRRTVKKTNSSSWEIIQEAKKIYRAELEFDTLNKRINIFDKRGSDKGVYFIDTLNLRDVDIQSNSYDFYTKILAIGKDNIRVTLENFQYSNKIKTFIWKDDRYTDINSLTEDAKAKLNELSKPYRSYAADVIDLANSNEKYKILSYGLGDTISLISKDKNIKEKQRIVKIKEYPDEPNKNTCEIANITLKFEDLQKEFQDTTDTVNNITTDNGTIDGSAIDGIKIEQIENFEANIIRVTDLTVVNAKIENLYAEKANIGQLNAVEANIGTLNATKANITDLTAINATINNLKVDKANILDLNATNAKIGVLEVDTGSIKNLLAGNITGENIQAGGVTSDKLTIANGFITNLMVSNFDVSKLNAGDISTTKFRIVSASGNMIIADNTIQIRDNARARVQIGKDASNDYNMYVWDSTGRLMFDATGLKEDGIKNKIIRDDMISDNANISGAKINISSLVTSINGGTTTINSSKVLLDGTGQTLNLAFNSLKTEVQDIEVGGRNLIQNSKNPINTENWSNTIANSTLLGENVFSLKNTSLTTENYASTKRYQIDGGANYTFTMKVYIENNVESMDVFFLLRRKNSSASYDYSPQFISNYREIKDSWVIITKTMKIPSDAYEGYIRIDNNKANGNILNTIYFTDIKLEKGNKATDWTPAPEDVEQSINAVKEITTSNSTTIGVMQGQISTAINNSQIVKDGQTILLKDDYNRTILTVNSSVETIGRHESTINAHTGTITSVVTDVTQVKKDLTGITTRVGTSESNISTVTTNANKGIEDARLAKLQADKGVADALAASNKATTAQNTANTASTNANTANTKLGDIANDNKLTESEKKIAKKEWDIIVGERPKIEAEAVKFGVSANTLITQYNVLYSYITPLLTNLNVTSDIVGTTFRLNFANYYNARQDLLNAITSKAKALADTAQARADLGVTNANTAQTQANLGVTNANAAQLQANKGVADALTAFNKAGQVLIDAKAYTNAEITTVTTKVNSANSEISQLKNQILLKVEATDVTTAITNISIGGRNIIQPKKLSSYQPYNSIVLGEDGTITIIKKQAQYITINQNGFIPYNRTYTFSGIGTLDGVPITKDFFRNNKANTYNGGNSVINVDNTGYFTITETWGGSSGWLFHCFVGGAIGAVITLKNLKFEIGNKATDYTVAPEDVDQAIADTITINETKINAAKAEIKLETDRINLEVGKTNSVVTSHTTSINAVDGKISTAQTNAYNYTVSQVNAAKVSIKLETDSIKQSVSSVDSRVTTVTTTANNALTNASTALFNTENVWTRDYAVTTSNSITLKESNGINNLSPTYWYEVDGIIKNTGTNTGAIVIFKSNGSTFTLEKVKENGNNSNNIEFFLENGIPSVRLYGHTVTYAVTVHIKRVPRNTSIVSEISTTNTKVSTIETNLNSITSRVSAEESKTTTINGTLTSMETRLRAAEVKITDNSIISTVQATINTAKNDAINSANSTTTNKLASYSTTSQMNTAITQSINGVKTEVSNTYITNVSANNTFATKSSMDLTSTQLRLDFTASGGYNRLKNGNAKNGTSYWNLWDYNVTGDAGSRYFTVSNTDWTGFVPAFQLTVPGTMTGGEFGFTQSFETVIGKDYIFTCYIAGHRSWKNVVIRGTSDSQSSWLASQSFGHMYGASNISDWEKVEIPFKAQRQWTVVEIDMTSTIGSNGFLWAKELMISEGRSWKPFSPHPDEIYSGNTVIDAGGVTIYNGAIRVLDGSGNEILKGDSSGISFTGRLQPRDNQIKLFGENCKIDGSVGAIRLQKDSNNYMSVDSGATIFYNGYSNGGTKYVGIHTDWETHTQFYNQTTMIKMLNQGSPSVQARWAGDGGYCPMQASAFTVSSRAEYKENIHVPTEVDFIEILKSSEIKAYNYKKEVENVIGKSVKRSRYSEYEDLVADFKTGLILDELTDDALKVLHPAESDGIELYSMCSVLWKVCQEQQLKIEELINKMEQLL